METSPELTPSALLTQTNMDNFLSKMQAEIVSLKTKFSSFIHKIKHGIDGRGERVNVMEETLDSSTEDLEALSRRVFTLEDQQMDFYLKHKDLENRSWRNKIRIRDIPKRMQGPDLLSFVADLLDAIPGDPDTPPPYAG
ncbi:hypothetical protein NDU88_005463 [Pleurodeles waltl]|uniref:Uncharacterized protein n=1 Tax=Pleurodeles waltl TaxID=8319 RepID=A0AAV7PI65_PLEWA|nr:hypothetical protein NDU88_005463 [Pleurodeles waltl]